MRRALPLIVAILAFTAFGVLWIATDDRASERVYDDYSSANTGKTGLSLARGYLARRTQAAMLTLPVGRSPLEANAVVFRVVEELPTSFDPEELEQGQVGPPRPKRNPLLNDAEDAFVRRGGRFVIATASGALDMGTPSTLQAKKVFPIWPQLQTLTLPAERAFAGLAPRMHALFVAGEHVVIARERIGSGELILLAAPELLQNEHLPANLPLLAALAGNKRPVYFDEVAHGIMTGDGALALMQEWNLGPFLLLLGVLSALLFWREGRRIGPAEDDERETRSDAVDLVRSLGALYRDVTTDAEAIALYHEALTRVVAHQSGLRGEALHKRVDALTGGLVPPKNAGRLPGVTFRRMLAQVNDAFMKMRG